MDCGSNIFQSFDFGKRARTFNLNSFVGLHLTNTLAASHKKSIKSTPLFDSFK